MAKSKVYDNIKQVTNKHAKKRNQAQDNRQRRRERSKSKRVC